jgi:hypothetical protein
LFPGRNRALTNVKFAVNKLEVSVKQFKISFLTLGKKYSLKEEYTIIKLSL